jgi:hypothetical protein
MKVLASLTQTMLLRFAPPDRAGPGAGNTLKAGFGRGGRLFRHVGNTKADDAYFEIEVIRHR